ncbi:MAG: hypothetical protein Q8K36_04685, partial [Alphaproteobacteria bacterium]|nr:hypothetical protein [Alphaproteobacteria bacterium]
LQKADKKNDSKLTMNRIPWPMAQILYHDIQQPDILTIKSMDSERTYLCLLADQPTGYLQTHETPYYKICPAIQGSAVEVFADHVNLARHSGYIGIQVKTGLKPQVIPQSITQKPYDAQVSIFKNIDGANLLSYVEQSSRTQPNAETPIYNGVHRAWLELLVGNERACLSFLADTERLYPGISHHPFVRGLKTTAYIMDSNYTKAYEQAIFLPKTAENKLLMALIDVANGTVMMPPTSLRVIRSLYEYYTQFVRDEIMAPIILALMNTNEKETLQFIVDKVPKPAVHTFAGYFEYATLFLKLSASKDKDKNLRIMQDYVESMSFGRMPSRLQAHVLYQKLLMQMDSEKISTDDAIKELISLSYMWRGDQFEAMVLMTLSKLLADQKKYQQAMLYFQRIKDNYFPLFQIFHLQRKMEECFVRFFMEAIGNVSPIDAVSFYETYKDYTPDSAQEVDIIKTVSRLLTDLDLLEQSATLLTAATKNANTPYALVDLYLKAAEMHINNNNGELAMLSLNKIPDVMQQKYAEEIRLLTARAYAAQNNLAEALRLLDEYDTIDSLKLAADLLIARKEWDQARERLFQLIVRLTDKDHQNMKAEILMWLGQINILNDRIYDNQALAFVHKDFIAKQNKKWQESFALLTNDYAFKRMTREDIEAYMQHSGLKDFYTLYIQKKK